MTITSYRILARYNVAFYCLRTAELRSSELDIMSVFLAILLSASSISPNPFNYVHVIEYRFCGIMAGIRRTEYGRK